MDYNEIVNNVKKYHYYVTTQSKIIHLSSSNSKNEAKNLALEKLEPNIDNLIGKKILFIKIKSVNDEYLKSKDSDELQVIGGPVLIKFESGIIINSKKIKNKDDNVNNLIYLSNKYIKKNQNNIIVDIKNIINKYVSGKLNKGILSMNIL